MDQHHIRINKARVTWFGNILHNMCPLPGEFPMCWDIGSVWASYLLQDCAFIINEERLISKWSVNMKKNMKEIIWQISFKDKFLVDLVNFYHPLRNCDLIRQWTIDGKNSYTVWVKRRGMFCKTFWNAFELTIKWAQFLYFSITRKWIKSCFLFPVVHLYWHGLTLVPAWICNNIHYKVNCSAHFLGMYLFIRAGIEI